MQNGFVKSEDLISNTSSSSVLFEILFGFSICSTYVLLRIFASFIVLFFLNSFKITVFIQSGGKEYRYGVQSSPNSNKENNLHCE